MRAKGLEDVFRVLNESGARYLVAGGLAVVAHGYVRLTMDIDLVVQLTESNLLKALSALKTLGYHPTVPVELLDFASSGNREMWMKKKGMVVFQLVSDQFPTEPIDIFAKEPFDFDFEYNRAPRHELGDGLFIPVVGFNALMNMKRIANRPKDLIDMNYLRQLHPENGDT
ncbi:MAG: hypothetical protein KDL10_09540 [Kiritimatiellae bacterium]|mgnify:CR=1 FL=1|nr:hypothetical protein [Kiritimatiellia bacterium]